MFLRVLSSRSPRAFDFFAGLRSRISPDSASIADRARRVPRSVFRRTHNRGTSTREAPSTHPCRLKWRCLDCDIAGRHAENCGCASAISLPLSHDPAWSPPTQALMCLYARFWKTVLDQNLANLVPMISLEQDQVVLRCSTASTIALELPS